MVKVPVGKKLMKNFDEWTNTCQIIIFCRQKFILYSTYVLHIRMVATICIMGLILSQYYLRDSTTYQFYIAKNLSNIPIMLKILELK